MSKYKCNNCQHVFHRYTSKGLVCPSCGSDEVKKVLPWKSMVGMTALGIASVATGYFAADFFLTRNTSISSEEIIAESGGDNTSGSEYDTPSPDSIRPEDENTQTDERTIDVVDISSTSSGKMVLTTSSPRMGANGTYAFSVTASNVPADAIVSYELLNSAGNRIIAISKDGNFSGITSDATSRFIVRVRALVNGKIFAETTKVISGFGKGAAADVVGSKLTVGEVNGLFRSGSLRNAKRHPKIASNVSVVCSGLQSGDAASSIADVYYIQKMRNANATVVGLQYDASGKVTLIQFLVTYSVSPSSDVSSSEE